MSKVGEAFQGVIGIDLKPLSYTLTGIGAYVQHLVRSVNDLNDAVEWVFPQNTMLPFESISRARIGARLRSSDLSRISIQTRFSPFHQRRRRFLTSKVRRNVCDLYHVTNAQCDFAKFDMPFVITVHDLAWMRVSRNEMPAPSSFSLQHLETIIRNAAHVICDSECTRQDVLELAGRRPDDVTTVHLAQRPNFTPPALQQDRKIARYKATGGRPYFLAVSTVEPRKNYVRLAKAFIQLAGRLPDHMLLIAGAKRSAWPELRSVIRASRVSDRIKVLGHVSDSHVRQLLWGCDALVYPSLYEGFGLPALEAMATGSAVICSAAGSLGEVVEDAAVIVNPLDIDSIVDAMLRIASDQAFAEHMKIKAIKHSEKFSWTTTAQLTLDVYQKVISR